MIGETEILGVYLKAELVTSLIALILTLGLNRLLVFAGLHRHIWHPALFEIATFVILWGGVLSLSTYFVP